MKIAVFEPYFGGSHKAFIQSLCDHLPYDFELYTLPARKWKWRMRLAAPYFASRIENSSISLTGVSAILCSPFLDVAVFRGMLPNQYKQIPIYTYFHENQFAYPVQVNDERDFHFALTNITTALASDKIAFNSEYNLKSFINGAHNLLRISPDLKCDNFIDQIQEKAVVLYPGIEFGDIDSCSAKRSNNKTPVILWNHRWEHDKNPDLFFETLDVLRQREVDFKLIVVGQSFTRCPEIFKVARQGFKDKIIHFGYVESRDNYIHLLCQSDIVVSTSNHEFYGISVIEAVRAGCYPLLPDRLSYRELFPEKFRYTDGEFADRLTNTVVNDTIDLDQAKELTALYDWQNLAVSYRQWFEETIT